MKILLAVDFSAASEVAVTEVAARSWPPGTTIEVLNVFNTAPMFESSGVEGLQGSIADTAALTDPGMVEQLQTQSQDLVQAVASRLGSKGTVLEGDPTMLIVEHARETRADFVVLASHNATGLERFLLGSVARAVVHQAPCSVAVIRGAVAKDVPRKILLATDGSPSSEVAARSVAGRPWPAGTEVRVFSAVEMEMNTLQSALEPPFLEAEGIELREEAMKRTQDAIADAERILSEAGLATSEAISVLVEGPKQTIVQEAESWGADLIVVGSHGRSGLDRLLLGAVSEAVAMHAACSVEVIRKT